MIAAAAIAADGVELLDERIDERWIVGENDVLEVALALGLCKIGGLEAS